MSGRMIVHNHYFRQAALHGCRSAKLLDQAVGCTPVMMIDNDYGKFRGRLLGLAIKQGRRRKSISDQVRGSERCKQVHEGSFPPGSPSSPVTDRLSIDTSLSSRQCRQARPSLEIVSPKLLSLLRLTCRSYVEPEAESGYFE